MGMDELGECLRELLEAVVHLDIAAYRRWGLERIATVVPFDEASWQDAGQGLQGVVAEGQIHHWEEAGQSKARLGIRFRRRAPSVFSPEERVALNLLAAQACSAWRTGVQISLLRQLCRGNRAAALVDHSGNIHAVQGNIHAALRAGWPAWRDISVPPPLRVRTEAGSTLVAGDRRWTVESSGALHLVIARPLGVAGKLTAREFEVAAAVLHTGSQQAAAKRLQASVHTVRNTLVRVYSKLGVRNRVELAQRVGSEQVRDACQVNEFCDAPRLGHT
jgi:DNA-binding CsgD family transcriptional regulator